jgi:hypothetical protein
MGLSYNPSSVSDGIVLYLDAANPRSYAGTGTTWYDLSGNSNDAGFVNSPTYLSVPQPYFNFNGTNDYMKIVRSSSMSPTAGLTQEVWFNYPSVPTTAIFIGLQYGASSNNSYALWKESATTINGGVNTSGSFSFIGMGTTNLVGNRWYHFVHTYDGSTQKLYLNGSLMTTGSQSGTIQYDVNNTRVLIGADDNSGYNSGTGYFHSGKLSQVRIYNRGLSASEVLRNYNAQRKRYFQEENIVTNGLVLHLDANNANSYAGTGTSWYDLTGNGNDLKLTNGPVFTGTNGGIFTFDGTNDNANRAYTWPSDFTFDLFCKPISSVGGYDRIIGTGDVFEFAIGNDSSVKYYYPGAWAGTGVTITFGSYVQLCGVKSGSNFYLYKNGVLVSSGSISLASVTSLYLSSRANGTELVSSSISAFKIYNRALTSSEVTQNYNATKGRFGL